MGSFGRDYASQAAKKIFAFLELAGISFWRNALPPAAVHAISPVNLVVGASSGTRLLLRSLRGMRT
jgi:hypothetical protein